MKVPSLVPRPNLGPTWPDAVATIRLDFHSLNIPKAYDINIDQVLQHFNNSPYIKVSGTNCDISRLSASTSVTIRLLKVIPIDSHARSKADDKPTNGLIKTYL